MRAIPHVILALLWGEGSCTGLFLFITTWALTAREADGTRGASQHTHHPNLTYITIAGRLDVDRNGKSVKKADVKTYM